MKRWNKVLAMLLAIVMMTAMLPISAFADSWARVEATTEEDAAVLTVTVNAEKLAAMLQSGELLTGGTDGLLSTVELDLNSLMNVFTPEEILEIIPQDVLLKYFDAIALAEDVDPQKIMGYIEDYVILLEGCDLTKLPGFLPTGTDLSKIFTFSILINYVQFEDAYDYLLDAEVKKLLNERLKTKGVIEAFVEDLKENNVSLTDVINFSKLLSDGVISLNTGAVSTDAIKNSGLINFNDPALASKLIDANVFDLTGLESFMKTLPNAKSYFDTSKVLGLLDINDYLDGFDYSKFNINYSVFTEDHLNKDALAEEDYTVDLQTGTVSLTEIGKGKIAKNPTAYLTEEGMALLESQVSLEKDVYPLIDTAKLISDVGIKALAGCLIIDKALKIEGINSYISYTNLITFVGGIDAILNNANITIDYTKLDLAGLQNVTDVNAYVYTSTLLNSKIVPRSVLFAAAGGEGRLLDCVDTASLFANSTLLNKVVSAINADKNVSMTDVVNVSNFVNAVTDKGALVSFIGIEKIRAQIDNEELQEIIDGVDNVFDYVTDRDALISAFINELYWAIDKLTVDGSVIATENPDTATLQLDTEALVKTLIRLVPTLEELASLEGNTLISTGISLQYQGETATEATEKNVDLRIVLEGNVELLKSAAGKLNALLSKYFDLTIEEGGDVSLGINLPEVTTPALLATVYRELLDKDLLSDETAEKLLGLADAEFAGFIESLTIGDAADILGAVDLDGLYNAFVSISYVQTVLDKLEGKTGIALDDLTLDEMKDKLVTLPSAERICEIIEEKTGRDVRALLDSAVDRLDGLAENEKVASALSLIEEKLGYDLSDLSADEILGRAGEEPLFEKIASVISARVGRDVLAVLEENTVEELYAAAVEKATASEARFEQVQGYVLKALGYLPDSIADLRISDWYRGIGDFGGEFSFDLQYKSFIEKIARRVISAVKPDLDDETVTSILGRIPNGTLSCTVNVTNVHVTDVYQITYMDRAGEKVLLRAYLPAGADLTVFKNKSPEWLGYTFTGWADENGVELSVMPREDVTVYADLASVEVKLYDTNNEIITTLYLPAGQKIDAKLVEEIEELVTLHDVDSHVHADFHILWRGEGVSELTLSEAIFTKDTSLYAYLEPDYFMEIEGEYEFEVSYSDGVMNLVVQDKSFDEVDEASFRLSRDNVLKKFLTTAHGYQTIKISFKDDGSGKTLDVFELDLLMIRQLVNATEDGDEIFLEYSRLDAATIENPMYRGLEGAVFYDFNVNVLHAGADDRVRLDLGLFTGSMTVCLPFEDAIVNAADGTERTVVHVLEADNRERIASIAAVGYVFFEAPHFSEFVIANEYTVTQKFLFATTGTVVPGDNYLEGVDVTYPTGATFPIDPVFDSKYELDRIEVTGGALSADGKSVTMAEEGGAVTVTVYLKQTEAKIFYFVNGELYRTDSYRDKSTVSLLDINTVIENAEIKAPKGYTKTGAAWVGYDASKLGIADLYVFALWKPIEYTVSFYSEETNTTVPYTFTIENYQSIVPPAVPTVAGMTGAWESYDLAALFEGTDTALTVKALYSPVSYSVIVRYPDGSSDALLFATPGQTVSIPKILPEYHTAKLVATDEDGNEIAVNEWSLTMPASAVTVTVTYEPVPLTYTVNGVTYHGYYNENISFVIRLTKGESVASISEGCVYAGRVDGVEDGVEVSYLTYQFPLTEANCAIEYTVKAEKTPTENVYNGNLYTGSKAPTSTEEDVEFAGWATGVAGLNFATFRYNGETSMLWLWILLAILLLVALIAQLHVLDISGRMKKNPLARAASAIVSAFFAVCFGICAAVLWVLRLFGIGKSLAIEKPAPAPKKETKKAEAPKKTQTEQKPKQLLPPSKKHKRSKKKRKKGIAGVKQGGKWKQTSKRKKSRKRKSGKRR